MLITSLAAEVKTWRVGDVDHPWNIALVSGLTTWGRGWAVEIVADDDGDGLFSEDPINGRDDDGDGLIDEDAPIPVDGPSTSSTALRPVRLDSTRNLSSLIYAHYLYGDYGGVSRTKPNNPTLNVPGENGVRREQAKPTGQEQIIDGDLSTVSILRSLGLNLKGSYYIDRLLFRPRPILPEATVADLSLIHI